MPLTYEKILYFGEDCLEITGYSGAVTLFSRFVA